jgi:hypothetical protein
MSEFDFGAEYAAFGDDLKGTSYEGTYEMVVQKAVPGQTQKGKAQFTLTLAWTSGPLAAKGKTIVDRLIWSPESDVAARIFSQNLRTLGASQDWIMQTRPSPAQIAEQITGAVFEAVLKPDEFNGQPTTRVNYRKSVKVKGSTGGTKSATASAAVSLDDDDAPAAVATPTAQAPADTPAEAVPAGAGVGTGDADASNPWS